MFYGIANDVIGDCCYEEYKERRRELAEKSAEEKEAEDDEDLPPGAPLRERLWRSFEVCRPLFSMYDVSGRHWMILYNERR